MAELWEPTAFERQCDDYYTDDEEEDDFEANDVSSSSQLDDVFQDEDLDDESISDQRQDDEEAPAKRQYRTPLHRANDSARFMQDMMSWWVSQSTPKDWNIDDISSSSEHDAADPLEHPASEQEPEEDEERPMVKLWKQRRVVPGFYGLFMHHNEAKATMGEGDDKTKEESPRRGAMRSQSHTTCDTEAMTETSVFSHELENLPEENNENNLMSSFSENGIYDTGDSEHVSSVSESAGTDNSTSLYGENSGVFLSVPTTEKQESATSRSAKQKRKRRRWVRNFVIFAGLFIIAGAAVMFVSSKIFGDKNDNGDNENNNNSSGGGGGSTTTADSSPNSLKDLLSGVALEGGAEFEDSQSYQSQALAWLGTHPNVGSYSDAQKIQRWVLACLYYSTAQKFPWVTIDGWLSNDNECDAWFGVTCDATGRSVVGLELRNNGLVGTLPPELSLLSSTLKILDLNGNSLSNTGDDGHAFFKELTGLQYLNLGSNNFAYDGIPSQFGLLSDLIELDVSHNQYVGPLDGDVFRNMPELNVLRLGGNVYASPIPVQIGQLPNLEYLHIQNASITGDLSFMEPMQDMYEVWLDRNPNLSGTIPTALGKLMSLVSVALRRCGLTGTIPTELGLLTDLQRLWLNANGLTGTIPIELGNLDQLERLEVRGNLLTGSMPQEICSNVEPNGVLEVLVADCLEDVECACCTKCF